MSDRRRRWPAWRALVGLAAAALLLVGLVPVGLAAPSGTVSGVLEVERMLTAQAVAVVTILDQGAAPTEALIVGQQRSSVTGTGSIPFSVRYDPARIDPARPYVLYASIVDGSAVLQSTNPVPVITGGPEAGLSVPMALRPAMPASVAVTVVKKDKTALSATAVAQVGVVKVGSGRFASSAITVAPGQVPVALGVPYDPALVDPAAEYVAKAAIIDGGAVWESLSPVAIDPGSTTAITIEVTLLPTRLPTVAPSPAPTAAPTTTPKPTAAPTATPKPTAAPTATPKPTAGPTAAPTASPTASPTAASPTASPTAAPTATPSTAPSATAGPTATPRPTSGAVTGTLVYAEPAKLSGGAKAVVALLDEGNGSSVAVVSSEVIPTPGQQPIAFSLEYATAAIDPGKAYTIRAAIVDGDNAWVSATGVPVVTKGAPTTGVVVPLTYRPDLLQGEVTGSLTGIAEPLGDGASSVTMVIQPDTGTVLGFDARPQPGATSPIPFSVPFNVADVDPEATYVVTSEVTDGERSWESSTQPPVITDGNPFSGVVVPLVAVATPTPAPTASPSPFPVPSATPIPTPGSEEGNGGPPWWLLIVGLVVISGIAAFLYMRRNATPPPDGPPPAEGGPDATPSAEGGPDGTTPAEAGPDPGPGSVAAPAAGAAVAGAAGGADAGVPVAAPVEAPAGTPTERTSELPAAAEPVADAAPEPAAADGDPEPGI